MAQRELRVDTGVLATHGQGLLGVAGAIPAAPAPVVPAGGDPLSSAIAAQVAEVVAPMVAARPAAKAEATRYAQAVVNATRAYESTDKQAGAKLHRLASGMPDPGAGVPGGVPASGGGGGVGGPAGPPRTGVPAGGARVSPVAGGQPEGLGSMGQWAGTPMQMASRAGQLPMQMGAAIPQGMMQGARAAMAQVSQVSQAAKAAGGPAAGGGQDRFGVERAPEGVMPADSAGAGAAGGSPTWSGCPTVLRRGPARQPSMRPPRLVPGCRADGVLVAPGSAMPICWTIMAACDGVWGR